ncbi:MAG: methanogenesis marker protein Mmp4/MtxX [Methermicoccaceae archaeon]
MDRLAERITQLASPATSVAVGLSKPDEHQIESIVRASRWATPIVVCPPELEACVRRAGLEAEPSPVPHERLVQLLVDGSVDAAVRGSLSATLTLTALKEALSLRVLHRAALLGSGEHEFILAPVGVDEGEGVEDRVILGALSAQLLTLFGIAPSIGVLSGGRLEDRGRSVKVDTTLDEAQRVAESLCEMGYRAVHCGILLESAVCSHNVLIAPDGVCGNLIFRTLVLVGGGVPHGAPVLDIDVVFVDTSRVSCTYERQIVLASALASARKGF